MFPENNIRTWKKDSFSYWKNGKEVGWVARKVIEPFQWMGFTSIYGLLRFVLLFLILIPLLLMGIFAQHEYYNAKDRTLDHLNQMAILQRNMVNSIVESYFEDVKFLAGQEFVRTLDDEAMGQHFDTFLKSHRNFKTVHFINRSGQTLPLSQEELSIYVGDQEAFQKTIQGESTVTDNFAGLCPEQYSVFFSVPVFSYQGTIEGVMVVSMAIDSINSLLQSFRYGESGTAFLMRKDGQIISTASSQFNKTYRNILETRIKADSKQYPNLILQAYPDYRGINVFGVHQELNRLSWLLVAEVDQKEVLAPFYKQMLFLAGVYLVLIFLAIPVIFLMLRRIRLPIEGMLQAARMLQKGEFDTVIPQELISPSPRELKELAHAFNHMGSKIKEDIELLNLMNTQLRHVSLHDPLTGLYNRAYFEEEMHRLNSGRFNPIGIIVCDVNSLKVINDALGHQVGDELIKKAGRVLKESLRESDVIARIGGDEFVIILPSTSEEGVREICYRIASAVDESNLETPQLPLYMAMGMAVSNEVGAGTLEKAFGIADDQMYEEKMQKNTSVKEKMIRQLLIQNHTSRVEQMARSLEIG